MVLVIPLMAYLNNRSLGQEEMGKRVRILKLFPLFVIGFLAMATIRSLGDVGIRSGVGAFGIFGDSTWTQFISILNTWAGRLLVVALAGVGLSTNLQSFKGLGLKPFFVGLSAAFSVGFVSFVTIMLLGDLVTL